MCVLLNVGILVEATHPGWQSFAPGAESAFRRQSNSKGALHKWKMNVLHGLVDVELRMLLQLDS